MRGTFEWVIYCIFVLRMGGRALSFCLHNLVRDFYEIYQM